MSLEKFKTYAAYFFGMCACLYSGYTFFYENDKWHLLLFSIVLYALLYMVWRCINKKAWSWLCHCISFFVLYSAILAIFFSSSFLQIQEFRFTHSNWVLANQVQINAVEIDNYRYKRSPQYAYTRVQYQYTLNEQTHTNFADKINRQYILWFLETSQDLKTIAKLKTDHAIDQQQFSVYVNTHNPSQSRFFLNQDYFELRNSGFAWLIYSFQMLSLILVILVIIIIWDAFSDYKESKTAKNSKTKHKVKVRKVESDVE